LKDNFDIESLFKSQLEGLEADPGISWSAIQSQLGASKVAAAGTKSLALAKAIKTGLLVTATLAGGIGIGYFAFNGSDESASKNQSTSSNTIINSDNEILIESENLSVKEINSINKPDKVVTILEVKKDGEESQKVLVEIRQSATNPNASIITNWLSPTNKTNKDLIDKLLNEIDHEGNVSSNENGNEYIVVQKLEENDIIAGIKASQWSGNAPLSIDFSNITSAKSYEWNFGDNTFSKEATPKHTFEQPGNYIVELTITDANGRKKSNKTLIEVSAATQQENNETQPSSIVKYNVFTPNGDGENDEFFLGTKNLKTLELMVYDQKGNLMYATSDVNHSWNGLDRKGNPAPEGNYQCVFKAIGYDNVEHKDKFMVTLSRSKR
jgi:gliding motility-associated-like protein